MKTQKTFAVFVLLAGLFFTFSSVQQAFAQDVPQPPQAQDQNLDQAPDQDPPGRVAQLNYSVGSVSMQPGGQGDWVQAVENRPLTGGDNIWADKDARAELHIGSTAIRMDSETSLTFLDVDDHVTQLKLSQGSIVLRVEHLDDGDTMEVDTPNLAFDVQATGEYRIDVNEDGNQTDTTVWRGRGEATGGGASYVVVAGQRAIFSGTDQLDHEINQIPANDDFDNFSFTRDQQEDRSESANYISPEMTGYEDLDGHGRWHYVADYGTVWTPNGIAADWAPYRMGHWVWIAPWGWTWVDDEPWGFAPFHYGRWAFVESSWCWLPGPVVVRPVYAPALVAFVGGGGFSFAVGVGGPGVAWFPLGPREVYMPWYRTSRVYLNNVNITNTRVTVTQVTNVYNTYNVHGTAVRQITYVNQRGPYVTAVSRDTFINARPVARNFVRVDEAQIARAPVSTRVEVQPVRASMVGAGAPARFHPPTAVVNRPVIATRPPNPRWSTQQDNSRGRGVRTETPQTPQPAGRPPEQSQRPALGNPGVGNQGQPWPRQQPPQPNQGRAVPAQPPQPSGEPGPRPQPARAKPAVQAPEQQPVPQPQPAPRPPQPGNDNQRGSDSSRSTVRQAPPVQQRPETQRSEEQKFGNWQRQRESQPAPQPQSRAPEQRAPQPQSRPQPAPRAPQQHSDQSTHNDNNHKH